VAELVIRNGLVVDGTGAPPVVGDVATTVFGN
jgi:N-acyl-D-aspartate/D-glutamate deacylase